MQQDSMNHNSDRDHPLMRKLFEPVDNSPLILFRIIFGFLLFFHVCSSLLNGSIYKNFVQPPFCFTYIGFEFLQPLHGYPMYFLFGILAILALLIMLGAWYRFAITGFAFLWTVQYLLQKSGYNNHYYLILLLCWLMAIVPANANYSVEAARKASFKRYTTPRWTLWIFAFQISIVYFFAAISKLNTDWFSGKFLSIQFSHFTTHRVVGILYAQKWFYVFISYAGFFFDLLIVPLLAWKKTRKYAFVLVCLFHLFNSYSFHIGIFPYLSIAFTLFFFEPGKVRHIFFRNRTAGTTIDDQPAFSVSKKKLVVLGLSVYFFLQIILPIRSWFYPGNVFWTEEGYRMSWKMMMRTKSGSIYYKIIDPSSGKTWITDPKKIFSPTHVMWLSISPDIIWQYAQRLKKEFSANGYTDVKVYAIGAVSLNGNTAVPLIDTTIDLAGVEWHAFRHSSWITSYKAVP